MAYDIMLLREVNLSNLNVTANEIKVPVNYIFDLYNNDIHYDDFGRLMIYDDKKKLIQNLLKAILTQIGKNLEDPEYGSELYSLVGRKVNASLYSDINEAVIRCIDKYVELNRDIDNSAEYIESLDNIVVLKNELDPRSIIIKIEMTLENGESLGLAIPVIEELE